MPPWATLLRNVLLITVSVEPSLFSIPPPTPKPSKEIKGLPLPPLARLPISVQFVTVRVPPA